MHSSSPLFVGLITSAVIFGCCCIVAYSAGAVQSYLTPEEVKSARATATAVARETATAQAVATKSAEITATTIVATATTTRR